MSKVAWACGAGRGRQTDRQGRRQVSLPASDKRSRRLRPPGGCGMAALLSVFFLGLLWALALPWAVARAQQAPAGIMAPGDAVVSGFPGTRQENGRAFIDTDGPVVKAFGTSAGLPAAAGQVLRPPAPLQVTAGQAGLVFAIALDNAPAPNIYVAATSLFGLHVVRTNAAGQAEPVTRGGPGTLWMPGQWGAGGGPGSIWKIDGTTGKVSLFADLPNSGAALGDIAYDPARYQFFVSDLDSGLIYRLDTRGNVLGTYDHGTAGREAAGLQGVGDDDSRADLTSADFDADNPNTWGYTDIRRRVRALAVWRGRLYYSVDEGPQIWSVGFAPDGQPAPDARIEIDMVTGGLPITDIAFTPQGQMLLAQRGQQLGGADFKAFQMAGQATVLRYARDPLSGKWDPVNDAYAIGAQPPHRNGAGGVALSCEGTLWASGDNLRGDDAATPQGGALRFISGVEALDVRQPLPRVPGGLFIDFDGRSGMAEQAGHAGDVEVFRDCKGPKGEPDVAVSWPGFIPPGDWTPPPAWQPPVWWPPAPRLDIFKNTASCGPDPALPGGRLCSYTIDVFNSGGGVYSGFLNVTDTPGPGVSLVPPPGGSVAWACAQPGGPGAPVRCASVFPVALPPGAGETLVLTMRVPPAAPAAAFGNCASLPGGASDCLPVLPPPGGGAGPWWPFGLDIAKRNMGCTQFTGGLRCRIRISVRNPGFGFFFGPLAVNDAPGPGVAYVPAVTNVSGDGWACSQAGAGNAISCSAGGVSLPPFSSSVFEFRIFIPGGSPAASYDDCATLAGGGPTSCITITNRADLQLTKTMLGRCTGFINKTCRFNITVTNIGTATFNQPITVREALFPTALPPGATLQAVSAPWSCGVLPRPVDPPAVNCSRPPISLAPGASTSFVMRLQVPFGGWWLQRNCARVQFADATPGNNLDCAVLIDPANLKLSKKLKGCADAAGGRSCTFAIEVHNDGPDPYRGTMRVVDTLPGGTSFVSASGAGWSCSASGAVVQCSNGGFQNNPLPAGASTSFDITVSVPDAVSGAVSNCAEVKHRDDNDADNRDCAAIPPKRKEKPQRPQVCPSGTTPYPRGVRIPKGWEVAARLKNGTRCARYAGVQEPPPPPPEAGPTCGPGEEPFVSTRKIPRGWRARLVRRGGRAIWCAAPRRVEPPRCAPGEERFANPRRVPRGWKVRRVRRGGRTIWCARPVARPCPPGTHRVGRYCRPDRPQCPPGMKWNGEECVPVVRPCPPGTHRVGRYCKPNRPHCPPRMRWNGETCVPIVQRCPPGMHRVGRRCVRNRPKCPPETRWNGEVCVPIVRPCPPGTHRVGRYCRPNRPHCPPGMKWNGETCVPRVQRCPPGTHRAGRHCVPNRPNCPRGMKWNGEECVPRVQPCPPGMHRVGKRCVGKPKPHRPDVEEGGKPPVRCPPATRRIGNECRSIFFR